MRKAVVRAALSTCAGIMLMLTGSQTVFAGLEWSTFLGGSSDDSGYAVAVDSTGCVYVTGRAGGSSFPTQSGYDESFNGDMDSFVTKFESSGAGIVYSTFIGGSGGENSYNLLVNNGGEAYVAGNTNSSDFPTTTGAYDRSYHAASDIVVFKLNAAGNGLSFSTLLGGNANECAYGLVLDSSGNVYISGITDSTNFPVTTGSHQGYYDAYVCKFDADCSDLLYAMYIGGNASERAYGLAVDSAGCAYAAGWTQSENFPTTSGAYDASLGGDTDSFIAKVNSAGTGLVYSTYLGGSGDDYGTAALVDASGCVYVSGATGSAGLATSGAYQETKASSSDAFVAKLDADGSDLEFFTYLGGNGSDGNSHIAFDSSGDIIVTGDTESSDFPVTAGTYQCLCGGETDVFVCRLDSGGSDLEYSTYLGGSDYDNAGWKTEIDDSGCVYVAGYTESSDFPVTSGAWDETQNGGGDAFVTKLSMVASPAIYTVTVFSIPPCSGSVGKNPNKNLYAYGEQVTLTAFPAYRYGFNHWAGDANGSENPKTVMVTGNMNIAAYFTNTFTLTTSVSPLGVGFVDKYPNKQTYAYNEVVMLVAYTEDYEYEFSYWSGDLGGSQNPEYITMTGNASVTANFTYQGGCR